MAADVQFDTYSHRVLCTQKEVDVLRKTKYGVPGPASGGATADVRCILCPGIQHGQEKPIVADQLMFIPRVGAGGFTAQQRADHVNDRIATIIGTERLDRRNIHLQQHGDFFMQLWWAASCSTP